MRRPTWPRSVKSRLLAAVVAVVGVSLAIMIVGFNVLLGRSLESDAQEVVRSRAATVLATVDASSGHIVVDEPSEDSPIDGQVWVFDGDRAVEAPVAAGRLGRAARDLTTGPARLLDAGGTWLYADPVVGPDGRRVGTVVAGVSLAPYDQTRRTALIASVALAASLFGLVVLVARSILGRALTPVTAMTRAASDWSEREPDRRFAQGPPHDELTELAATLDTLLDRLAASLRYERRFSAELSHELRTPLARITATAELALSRTRTADDHRAAMEAVQRNAQQMTRAVDALVAAAREEADPRRSSCDATDVLHRVAEACGGAAQRRADRIDVLEPGFPVRIGASADIVERILQPVAENACRYARSEARLSVARDAGRVRVLVEDDGPGVGPDEAERIFEPSVRGRAADGDRAGAGLGLALARRLAASADGSVTAVAGERGLFVIDLPAA